LRLKIILVYFRTCEWCMLLWLPCVIDHLFWLGLDIGWWRWRSSWSCLWAFGGHGCGNCRETCCWNFVWSWI
jgi:hypothetical protein